MFSLPHESEPTLGDNYNNSNNTYKPLPVNGICAGLFNSNTSNNGGALTPDIKPNNPLLFLTNHKLTSIKKIGKYVLSERPDKNLIDGSTSFICQALEPQTGSRFVCKGIPIANHRKFLEPYWVAGNHDNIKNIHEILLTEHLAYVFFKKSFEDLHSYIRRRRKLKDDEVCWLFSQIVSAVKHCHDNGIVLRDLKLRKFVFEDSDCTHLLLDNLEDSCVLTDQDSDLLTDRHGCPAYVSPEILFSIGGYSGKLADVWSLGVIFYTLLAGQYPFHDTDVGALFKKIRQGVYPIPEGITRKGKCLLRNLLRVDSTERMNIDEIFAHPWFKNRSFQRFNNENCKMRNFNVDCGAYADNLSMINSHGGSLTPNNSFNGSTQSLVTGSSMQNIQINSNNNDGNNINFNVTQGLALANDETSNNVPANVPSFSHVDSFAHLKNCYSPQTDDHLSKLDQLVPVFEVDK